MIKVYIVEDHGYLLDDMTYSLKVQGFDCHGAADAEGFDGLMSSGLPDVVVLDWTLPGEDGLAIAQRLRHNKNTQQIGIIFLTARSSLHERLIALEVADSYQIKPIDYHELGAIISSIYRRLARLGGDITAELSWRLYEKNRELHAPNGDFISLSLREYSVISKLSEDILKPVSAREIIELWGEDWVGYEKNRIELLFSRLRKKIKMLDESAKAPIKAIRNKGYFLKIPIKVIKHDKLSALANHYSYPTSISEIARTLGREKHLELGNQVCELMPQAVMITDKDKNIIRVNNAFCVITGYPVESILGCNPRVLSSGRQDKEFYQVMWSEINSKDEWEGKIFNRRKSGEIYYQSINIYVLRNLEGEIENYIALFSDITQEQANLEYLKDLSGRDQLTGLPNRRLLERKFNEVLAMSKRHEAKFSLLFIDLNEFKLINDQYGHVYGDILLQMVASRIEFSVREVDCVARFGGDEFVILMMNIEHENSGEVLANKLKAIISKKMKVGNDVLQVTASIGEANYPEDGINFDDLHHIADRNMYADKYSRKRGLLSKGEV